MPKTRTAGTKIVATLGPATASPETLERLLRAGTDVVRLNFSHGRREDHARAVEHVRAVSEHLDRPVAIMGDLCGPKVRLLEMEGGGVDLTAGDRLRIVREPGVGNAERVACNRPQLVEEVEVGHRVLIDDGAVRLRVVVRTPEALVCECEVGGKLGSRKGVNLPDSDLRCPALTEKDEQDAAWAVEAGLEYLALSFVRRAADVEELRRRLTARGADCHILAKIETRQAVDNLDAIIAVADGILVARGDLGVELDVATVPRIQKDITQRCHRAGKPVIIATQMLQSMVESPVPTRAEVNDAANAIYDGADAVLLSAETAIGQYPVQAVEMLEHIALETEAYDPRPRAPVEVDRDRPEVAAAVAAGVCSIAEDINAKAVALWTQTGKLARLVSKHRLDRPVVALTPSGAVLRRMSLYYGIIPLHAAQPEGPDALIALVYHTLTQGGWAGGGDFIVVGLAPRSLAFGDVGSVIIHKIEER